MSETLEERVLQELQKTGFPTEIVSASVMQKHGWHVLHNPSYLDDSDGRSREFDIRAYRNEEFEAPGNRFSVGIYLMTECKKSEKPWVFFTTTEEYDRSRLGVFLKWNCGQQQVFTDRHHRESIISDKELREFHHYYQLPRLARTFHEPFKGNEKSGSSQMIYSAVMSALKAALFLCKETPIDQWLRVFIPSLSLVATYLKLKSVREKKSFYCQVNSFNYLSTTYYLNHQQVRFSGITIRSL